MPLPEELDDVDAKDRVLVAGRPNLHRTDNMVRTAKYTTLTFLPIAVMEQFRRFANLWFLMMGCVMAVGWYTSLFESAINPWTTLGPLGVVVSFSLMVEASSDAKRHRNDDETNNAPCVILRRTEELEHDNDAEREAGVNKGNDVAINLKKGVLHASTVQNLPTSSDEVAKISFQRIRRMNIRQGHFILVRNREMVPADMVLLASSSDNGSSYIETSSIDGETNLKLRTSPTLPRDVQQKLRAANGLEKMESISEEGDEEDHEVHRIETLEQATKRVARFSALTCPDGVNVYKCPTYKTPSKRDTSGSDGKDHSTFFDRFRRTSAGSHPDYYDHDAKVGDDTQYFISMTTEPPNPHVNTFSGKLTIPPLDDTGECYDIPLGAENILLRGAVLRNTEWAIGFVVFTGTDTKLVRNSFKTPSKFSQLDILMNQTVLLILCLMFLCICYLSTFSIYTTNTQFDQLWYVGFGREESQKWPYLPDLEAPTWAEVRNWPQMFFLFLTLLNNLVPLSLYVTVEIVTFTSLWFIYVDLQMYDDVTDTRAVARSTIVTDLGRVQYIFSDKTGTLTQNVMRFKRCSVDGMVFGSPITKARPGAETPKENHSEFHPLRHLLVGSVSVPRQAEGLEGLGETSGDVEVKADNNLTLNAEMFLRCLSLCHTVVVEKDLDQKDKNDAAQSDAATQSKHSISTYAKKLLSPKSSTSSHQSKHDARSVEENAGEEKKSVDPAAAVGMGPDGAPSGFAYQAESPDEGALVSAASSTFGFQVISRDSSGILLRSSSPSILSDQSVIEGLKNGSKTLLGLAAETATKANYSEAGTGMVSTDSDKRLETWAILAVNKFDSERKRMSILLRSPESLGSLPILFCKGADSAMLLSDVCAGLQGDGAPSSISEGDEDTSEWEVAQTLGMQAHLGEFASEGLRTLVLGMRILSEDQCASWLEEFKAAATAIDKREEKLKKVAYAIEKDLYIVGATAIEDKLQVGVPETIATLEKAGIKLWVLTGDKRETAVEIGYSTHVLTPKMHVTEVPDQGVEHVRTQLSMEFIRLVKQGKMAQYQKAAIEQAKGSTFGSIFFSLGKSSRSIGRNVRVAFWTILKALHIKSVMAAKRLKELAEAATAEKNIIPAHERRRNVRDRADTIIQDWLKSPEGIKQRQQGPGKDAPDEGQTNVSLTSDDLPRVFNRAQSARMALNSLKSEGSLSKAEKRSLSLAQLTAASHSHLDEPLVDEDTLSLASFFPDPKAATKGDFDRKKRTLLERLFAVDRDVRKGMLMKHMNSERLATIIEQQESGESHVRGMPTEGPRAIVIEGAALKHLLGDPDLEEILFSVCKNCEAVIACRVSPKQKALLVNLVRQNIQPEPVTLAIGDGANDVGMIQEAHVGVGISGKEGKQAVNASDFAIAQFRFLKRLVLIHGRWNFFRLSVVVLFSFYKNATMVGCIIFYSGQTVFSGTPLFDEWIISVLNFVAGIPIIVLGLFDRCLSAEYVYKNPEVFKASRNNEVLSLRTRFRWVILVFAHAFTIYYLSVYPYWGGGGYTSSWQGLMAYTDQDSPGDGEGGDLKSVGLVAYSCLVLLLGYKVLLESKSLIHGRWPAFTCRKDVGEGFFSRLAYTWHGLIWLSYGFYFAFFLGIYNVLGRSGAGNFSDFVDTATHVFLTRSINYIVMLFVPIGGILVDIGGKLFSNMYYPTQTQIHMEIEAQKKYDRRRHRQQLAAQRREAERTYEA